MSKLIVGLMISLLLCLNSAKVYAEEVLFSAEVYQQLKLHQQGKKWLLVLWSVDCPACFKELALLNKLRESKKDIALVLINVDDHEDVALQRQKIIAQYQLSDLPNFYFAQDQGDKSRYIIDPTWYGELPRSYFIDKQGTQHGKSGLLDETLMVTWLRQN